MSDPVIISTESQNAAEGFAALVDGSGSLLGTGYSPSVELSFIAMALIAAYVAISTARYFLSGSELGEMLAVALGFREL
jgi:hypothetical protein